MIPAMRTGNPPSMASESEGLLLSVWHSTGGNLCSERQWPRLIFPMLQPLIELTE